MRNKTLHWAKINERGTYWGMRLVLFMQKLLGRYLCLLCMLPVTLFYFVVARHARLASLDYLARLTAFFPHLAVKANYYTSFKHFFSFTMAILDKLASWNNQIGIADVSVIGREIFLEAIAKKQGAVILISHLGNIEITRALASINQRAKLNVLIHSKNSQSFSRLVSELSDEHSLQLIEVTEINPAVAIMLQEKIAQGEFVCIAADRVPIVGTQRMVSCDFLGHKANFPQGAFILASLLACPVFTLFSVKQKGRYHLYYEFFAERIVLERRRRQESLAVYAQLFAKRLEKYCEKAPLQWFNFYFYWQASQDSQEGE